MDKFIKFGIVGGDRRIVEAAKVLRKNGHSVSVWGIDSEYFEEDLCKATYEETVKDVDVLILPTPPSEDEVRVNCPLFTKESGVKIHKLLDAVSSSTVIMGGRISPRLREFAAKRNLKIFDYFNREELLIKNAVPTAEGAIGIAIDKLPKTLFGSKVAVVGYGRIGEALASRLNLLGANVSVFARKSTAIAKAISEGLNGIRITYKNGESSLAEVAKNYDVIYNTVPYWIITEDIVSKIPRETLVVDLASAPGGIDMIAAKKYDLEVIHALALPAKTAPSSAGAIVAESIMSIIEEEVTL